jgi:hypothetical protein
MTESTPQVSDLQQVASFNEQQYSTDSSGVEWDCTQFSLCLDLQNLRDAAAQATPSNCVLLAFARKNSPPDSWWEEDDPFRPDGDED